MGILLLVLSLVLRLSLFRNAAHATDSNGFIFTDGFSAGSTTLDGATTITGKGLLRLTNDSVKQKGRAFYSTPLHFRSTPPPGSEVLSFSTTFVLAFVPKYPIAGPFGMGFVIVPDKRLQGDLDGKYLGVFNQATNGNASNHILAIDFTTFTSRVSIDVNGIRRFFWGDDNRLPSNISSRAGYYADGSGVHHELTNLTLLSGDPLQVWVDYDGEHRKLDVTMAPLNVSRPKRPLISAKINLSGVLLDTMYVGFTGATGEQPISQYVLGWSFQVNGRAQPLDLARLPELPPPMTPKTEPPLLAILLPLATAAVVLLIIGGAVLAVWRKRKFAELLEDWEVEFGPHRFSYRDLFSATNGFKDKDLLGSGGFGRVYRGVLPSSKVEVAVKRVAHDSRQGMREFVAEIISIGRLRHRNLVQLLGYCRRKGELLLVYDYMPNGSLDKYLSGDEGLTLDWTRRLRIIKGVASGLLYLHEEWEQVVIHRDIKASNVLLDADLNGRLGDFGLARLYDHGTDPHTTHIVGTMGYIAPELTRSGKATKATDVFGFGVFLLEVACGRRPIEPNSGSSDEIILIDWVLRRWMKGEKLATVADRRLKGEFVKGEMELVLKLGLLCSHSWPESRPSMRQVMQILDGDLPLPEVSPEYWNGSMVPMMAGESGGFDYIMPGASSIATGSGGAGSLFLSGGR